MIHLSSASGSKRDGRIGRTFPYPAVVVALVATLMGACRGPTEPGEQLRIYEVAEELVGCEGVGGPTLCLSVRIPPDTAWSALFGVVEGFTHEAGYRYVLQIAERPIRNPPIDGSAIEYRLVTIVSRTAISP